MKKVSIFFMGLLLLVSTVKSQTSKLKIGYHISDDTYEFIAKSILGDFSEVYCANDTEFRQVLGNNFELIQDSIMFKLFVLGKSTKKLVHKNKKSGENLLAFLKSHNTYKSAFFENGRLNVCGCNSAEDVYEELIMLYKDSENFSIVFISPANNHFSLVTMKGNILIFINEICLNCQAFSRLRQLLKT